MGGERELAEEIRTGLARPAPVLEVIDCTARASDRLEERYYGKPIRQHVKEFGALWGAILLGVAAYRGWHGHALSETVLLTSLAGLLVLVGYRLPRVLRPIWRAWMALGHLLGMVVTFVLMSAVWIVMVIPLALGLRIFGKKVMEMRFRSAAQSYWEDIPVAQQDFKLLERQF